MKLADYISDMARRAELARAVDSNPDYLWQVATDRRKASHTLARNIEAATHGQVTRFELRPDIFGAQPLELDRPKAA